MDGLAFDAIGLELYARQDGWMGCQIGPVIREKHKAHYGLAQ